MGTVATDVVMAVATGAATGVPMDTVAGAGRMVITVTDTGRTRHPGYSSEVRELASGSVLDTGIPRPIRATDTVIRPAIS